MGDLYEGGSQWPIPWLLEGVRANADLSRKVRSDEVKQALLGIAKAWVKLAAQADAYKACEPQAPGGVDLQAIDFLSVFRRTAFLKNG